jgi:mycoredoxin
MAAITGRSPYRPRSSATRTPLVIYGRRGCALSQMIRRYLDRMGIPYEYIDLDLHPEAQSQLAWLTGGRVHSPTVAIGGHVLVQPTIGELQRALARTGVR